MSMYEIINKKKRGGKLSDDDISFAIGGYVRGEVPDYQMSALMMAIYFKGMDAEETAGLTMEMVNSGETVDLSRLKGTTVDKHSTGGVGDKTTLIVAPIVAACGLPVAKMSGRGLGHTGGTLDKLESIPGFRIDLTGDELFSIVEKAGLCIAGQSANLAPADKKLYALRDVTATVDSIPLIAASIMSKKIAAGADCILLDVKTGSGAFMKSLEDSERLARAMVDIGNNLGRKTAALITDMSVPLGMAIGNGLEVKEVIGILRGESHPLSDDLIEISLNLAANMLKLAGKGSLEECYVKAKKALTGKEALGKLKEMVEAQSGDVRFINNPDLFPEAPFTETVTTKKSGYISEMDSEAIGMAAMYLKAGRAKPEDKIDYSAGITLCAKTGDFVEMGKPLAVLYSPEEGLLADAKGRFLDAVKISGEAPLERKLVKGLIG